MHSYPYQQLVKILNGVALTTCEACVERGTIYHDFVCPNDIFFCINSSKYNSIDGGLGFTNNEDSVFGVGGNQNGHNHISEAIRNGASIIVIDDIDYFSEKSVGFIYVSDCLEALSLFVSHHINTNNTKVIAVTGSVGKTTTCQALVDSLSNFMAVKKIHRIRNSILAICLEIIQNLSIRTDCLILELQLDLDGQIDRFCKLLAPDIAIITNVYLSHYSRFTSIEKILYEKLGVYRNLKEDGILLINDDNEQLHYWCSLQNDHRIRRFGQHGYCDYAHNYTDTGCNQKPTHFSVVIEKKNVSISLSTPGIGIASAAMICLAVSDILSIPTHTFASTLSEIRSPVGRFNCFIGNNGCQVIIDSYNATFASMKQGIQYLSNSPHKHKILILGSMLELAEHTEMEHRKLGRYINDLGCNFNIITLGEAAMYIAAETTNLPSDQVFSAFTYEDIYEIIKGISLDSETIILIKGSGAMRLELIAPYFLAERIF